MFFPRSCIVDSYTQTLDVLFNMLLGHSKNLSRLHFKEQSWQNQDPHCNHMNPGGRCGPQSRADQPGNKKQGATTLPRKVNIWVPRQLVDFFLARSVKVFLYKSNRGTISPPCTEPADRLSSTLARARDPRSWPTSARSTSQYIFSSKPRKGGLDNLLIKISVNLTIYWKFE